MNIFSFPMEQIGCILRKLSLSGGVGNIIAIIIYTALCLIPIGIYLYLICTKKVIKVDRFLIFISMYAFVMMYFMVNPGLFPSIIQNAPQMMLGGTFYSITCSYLVIRILSACKDANIFRLQKRLQGFLYVLVIIFLFAIWAEGVLNTWSEIQNVNNGNSMTGLTGYYDVTSYTPTYIFLVIQGIIHAIPYVFDIIVTAMAIRVIRLLGEEEQLNNTVPAVDTLVKTCTKALFITVTSSFSINILQLLFQSMIYKTNFSVELPIFSLVFVLAILLFARYLQEYQKLKQDNDLFI
ncbi:MAG: hypothetical protein MR936_15130 [Eubacterium sp.]|nr:hypothetical protein [Eubacterium sp.]